MINETLSPQTRRLSLKKNFSWMSVGEAIDVLSRWGLLAVLSKLLNAEAVGLFGLTLAIIVPTIMFSNMGLRRAQATDVSHEYTFYQYRTLRRMTSAVALVVIALIAGSLNLGVEAWQVVMLVAVGRCVEAQSDVYYGLFQNRERMDYIAQGIILRSFFALGFFAFGIYFSSDLRVGCFGLILSSFLVLVFHNMRLSKRFLAPESDATGVAEHKTPSSLDARRLLALARLVFPLGCVGFLSSLQNNVPRYFVEHELGLAALGYFTAVAAPYAAATRLIGTLADSASARLARRYQQGQRNAFLVLLFVKLGGVGFVVGCAGVLVAALFGREILTILYAPDYAPYKDILVLVMIGAFVRVFANLWQMGIIAARRFWVNFVQHLMVVISAIVAGVFLVAPYGLRGAAFMLIVAATVHLVGVLVSNSILTRNLGGPRDRGAEREA